MTTPTNEQPVSGAKELVATVDEAREELRSAFLAIQRIKHAGLTEEDAEKGVLPPIWRAINAIPAALYHLDRMPEFEADLAAEEAATLLERQEQAAGKLVVAVKYYGETFCEGHCEGGPVFDEKLFDCAGCRARQALREYHEAHHGN